MIKFLFNHTVNPAYLTFFRIATGLVLLLSMLSIWPDFERLYGLNGIVDPELLRIKQGHSAFSIYQLISSIENTWEIDEAQIIQIILIVYIALCFFLILGFLTKLSALILLLLQSMIFTAQHQFSYGFDYFCTIALFYCVVFPVHCYASIDRRLFNLAPSKWAGFCLRILQLHVCFIYFFSGLEKIAGPTWRNGEALWKAVHLPYFESGSIIPLSGLAAYPWLWIIGGWLVCLLELLFPVFINYSKTRKIGTYLIIALHLSIAAILHLYLFSAIMIAFNLAAFYYDLPGENEEKRAPKPAYKPLSTIP